MSDPHQNQDPQQQEPVVYASPVKRTWAWVGVIYMLITIATFTYYLATAKVLVGIGPLLLCPALGGLCATILLRHRAKKGRGGLLSCVLLSGACIALLVLNLVRGIPALLQNFGGTLW